MKIKVSGINKNNKFMLDIISKSTDNYFDKLNIFFCDEDEVKIYDKDAYLSINENNIFCLSNDKMVIGAFIKIQCTKLELKRIYDLNENILNFISARQLIKNNFSNEIAHFYFWYLATKNKQIMTIKDFIDINIPWLAFYGIDENNSNMLKDMLKGFVFHGQLNEKCRAFFNAAKKINYEKINQEYELITNADNKI